MVNDSLPVSIIDVNTSSENSRPTVIEVCAPSRELVDCPLRRAECGSLYEIFRYLLPPQTITNYLKAASIEPETRAWLARLDSALPRQRPMQRGWR